MELQDLRRGRREKHLRLAEKLFVSWATQSLLMIRVSNNNDYIIEDFMMKLLTPLTMPL
jgi:hypothetical protein